VRWMDSGLELCLLKVKLPRVSPRLSRLRYCKACPQQAYVFKPFSEFAPLGRVRGMTGWLTVQDHDCG